MTDYFFAIMAFSPPPTSRWVAILKSVISSLVANRVVVWDKHTLNGATLNVSLQMRDSDEEKGKTIEVAGLAASTTEDSILNYFENKRRSGGGEVETVKLRSDTGVAFVTFKDGDGK